ncbi:MAG: polyamine aminopropyltransferase [Spirochaetales bacterium]|nr:polyamine aminopropyltransferase [Spirochaetales bacterium]
MPELLDPSGARREVVAEWFNGHAGHFYAVARRLVRSRTRFQDAELLETPFLGRVLSLDGMTQAADSGEFEYHEALAHPALLAHPDPRRVLVIGGGDGGILREVLRHPSVERAVMVELDGEVVRFSAETLPEISDGAFADARARVEIADGRAFVEGAEPGSFDVVIMDMTDPGGPSLALYTEEFFRAARRALSGAEGVFAMHAESPVARPAAFASIHATLARVFPTVRLAFAYARMYGTLWSYAFASEASDPARPAPGRLEAAFDGPLSGLRLLDAQSYRALFAGAPWIRNLLSRPAKTITDADPEFPEE